MIKFFRKIRQNLINEGKTSKYLKYAIGEIVLVVIGILIALQVNNWNADRIEQAQIKVYAKLLISDLEEDLDMSKFSIYQATEVINRLDSLTLYVQDKDLKDISNLDVLCLTSNLGYRPFSWNRAVMEELKSSGSLQSIKNDFLKMKIAQYDAFTHHLDQDYISDLESIKNCDHFISQIINKNYHNIKALYEVMSLYDTSEGAFLEQSKLAGLRFFSSQEYDKAKTQGLQLITNDINKVHVAINCLISLRKNLELRSGIELQKLNDDAEVLITLLKETYLN